MTMTFAHFCSLAGESVQRSLLAPLWSIELSCEARALGKGQSLAILVALC